MSRYKYDYDYDYDYEFDYDHDQRKHKHQQECVAGVVKKIVKAQDKVAAEESGRDCCSVSCERSIDQLLSPGSNRPNRNGNNTIPFVLFSKGKLKPFVGSGFRRPDGHFVCIESPVFRAKKFVGPDCVELELLLPVRGRRDDVGGDQGDHCNCGQCRHCQERRAGRDEHDRHVGSGHHGGHHHDHHNCRQFLCDFFNGQHIRNFRTTGVCITVDLNCFCAITCLDPIRPVNR